MLAYRSAQGTSEIRVGVGAALACLETPSEYLLNSQLREQGADIPGPQGQEGTQQGWEGLVAFPKSYFSWVFCL